MKGIITLYVNFPSGESKEVIQSHLALVKEVNKEMFAKIEQEMKYHLLFVPTTGESSRFEKTEFDTIKT